MIYTYAAYDSNGRLVEDEISGASIGEVLIVLQRQGLRPIYVKPKYSGFKIFLSRIFHRKKITTEDKIFLTKYLYLMLKVGTNLVKALDILKEDFPKPAIKEFLEEVQNSLKKGQPFWSSFAKYPKYFSPTFVAMIKAGETSGQLEETFKILSEDLEKKEALRKKIRSALIYPALLITVSLVVVGIIVFFAMPKITKIFLSTGINPPTFTRIVITASMLIAKYGFYFILFLFLTALSYYFFYSKTKTGREFTLNLLYRTPVLKNVLEKMDLQSLCSVLSSLLTAGLPIIEAIQITADTIRSPKMKSALLRIANNRLALGRTLDEAFREEKHIFPQTLISLIGMAEKAGHLEVTLSTLADFYTGEVDETIKGLMSVLEPLLLIMIGIIVAIVAFSTIIPMYQMVTKVAE